jgi:hypothetical protein
LVRLFKLKSALTHFEFLFTAGKNDAFCRGLLIESDKNGSAIFRLVVDGGFGLTTPKVGKIAKYSQVIEQKVRQNQK